MLPVLQLSCEPVCSLDLNVAIFTAMNVKLTPEQKITVLNSTDLYAIMQKILLRENKIRRNQEHFWIVGLDNRNKVLFIELISLGAVNRVTVNPPEVFRMAIYKLAVKVVLVHNHPSGDMLPSQPDLDLTNRMLKAGEIIKIDVIDHLIINENTFISFDQQGLIKQLKSNDSYRIVGEHEAELKALRTEVEKLEMKLEMARKMVADGVEIDVVSKWIEVPKEDLERLLKRK